MPAIIPHLGYDDPAAALGFPCEAFGFQERYRVPMQDSRIGDAEMTPGDGTIYLASPKGPESR